MKKNKLKILIAHHRWWYPTAVSGSDIANHEFAKCLLDMGYEIEVFGILPPVDRKSRSIDKIYDAQGVNVYLVMSDFISRLRKKIKQFKPHLVFTSCPESQSSRDDITRMVTTIKHFKIPIVLYVHELHNTLPAFEDVKDNITAILTNSKFMSKKIQALWKRQSTVIYPVPLWENVYTEKKGGSFITFFNPLTYKGLNVAHNLAMETLRDRSFLFVEEFLDPESHGIELVRSQNLVHARRSPDMASIYTMTKTLIIPSIWEEPFGRVALEAMYNNIPVIASARGGLVESVGTGGILIKDYKNPKAWKKAILSLDDQNMRKNLIKAGKDHVKNFDLSIETGKLSDIFTQILADADTDKKDNK